MIWIIIAVLAAAAVAAVAFKANRWDYSTPLRAAQIAERAKARRAAQVALLYFHRLDTGHKGVLTEQSLEAISHLQCSDSDKAYLRYVIEHAGPKTVIAVNPWLLARQHSYELTAIGHVVGERPERRVYASRHSVHTYTVNVPEYGISKADLRTYCSRVLAREKVGAT